MDKETGDPILDGDSPLTGQTIFTAEDADGAAHVSFITDPKNVFGKDTVVYETLYLNEVKVAEHKDIKSDDQSVTYPVIHTTAAMDDRDTIADIVEYSHLEKGRDYVMHGWLVDKKTGKKIEGTDSKESFTARSRQGSVVVKIKIPEGLKGQFVVYEECLMQETVIAEHKDLNDDDQTVTIEEEKPDEPIIPMKPGVPDNPSEDTPMTGDTSLPYLVTATMIVSGILIGLLRRYMGF